MSTAQKLKPLVSPDGNFLLGGDSVRLFNPYTHSIIKAIGIEDGIDLEGKTPLLYNVIYGADDDYGKYIVASGPIYKSHRVKGKKISLEFDAVGSGLMAKGAKLIGFEIAGADKKFVPADAKIAGTKIELCAKSISKPVYARYAWRDTSTASLFNKEGLPASSFTTEE